MNKLHQIYINWTDNTFRKGYDRAIAHVLNTRIAFSNYIPEHKEYVLTHSVYSTYDTGERIIYLPSQRACEEKLESIMTNLVKLATESSLEWVYPNSNEKKAYLVFKGTRIILAEIDDYYIEDEEYNPTTEKDGFVALISLFNTAGIEYHQDYKALKTLIEQRVATSLKEFC